MTDEEIFVFDSEPTPETPPTPPKPSGMGAAAFLDMMDLKATDTSAGNISYPWMDSHKFVLVETIDQLNQIVDSAIAAKECSLDLETEGLDNRIFYHPDGKPYTKHKIVGFCLCYDGITGYYAPIRHVSDGKPCPLNLPVKEAEEAITRLCRASQPEPTPDFLLKDPLSFREMLTPPKLIIYFWNAKFDQEFLYPVTGIDWWHPDSFEDGNLAYYVDYTDDKKLGLKPKAKELLRDDKGNPYIMIELKELFLKGSEIKFALLYPDEFGVLKYACSDAICTFLLCKSPRKTDAHTKDVMALVHTKYLNTYRIEKQCAQATRWMERPRVRVNREKVLKIMEENDLKRQEVLTRIQEVAASTGVANFDPAKTKILGEFLFGDKGLNITVTPSEDWPNGKPPIHEASKQFATDADTLDRLVEEHPEVPDILKWVVEWRGYEKINGTYLKNMNENIDDNSEMRFQFKQTGAATGRFSAPAGEADQGFSGIPIHGIPGTSNLRKCFEARPGYTMVKADYAGQELRIAANVSGEQVWIKEFLEGSGDLHTITARAFFPDFDSRSKAEQKELRRMGKCVHPDTLIYSNGVLQPISKLDFSEGEGQFLNQTDRTVYDGEENRSLTATYNGGRKQLYHVVISGGLVTCTGEHRFKLSSGELVRAIDLKPGDSLENVSVPQVPEDGNYPKLKIQMWDYVPVGSYRLNHHYAYFAGLYAGDGTGNDSSVSLTHGPAEVIDAYGNPYEDWIKVLEESSRICGFNPIRHGKMILYLGSRVLVRFLRKMGVQRKRMKRLRIPAWVLKTGRQAILHYLGGLFDTDGTVSGKAVLDWTTKDFVFAGQVAMAMKACGMDFNTELSWNKTYQKYYVRLRLTVGSSFLMKPYMKYAGKVSRLRPPIYESPKKDRFLVTKVLPAGVEKCVDISVEDSHIYLANGFVTHNTSNFALIYGGGPASIMRATGCDKMEATRRKAAFDGSVPTFSKWIKKQQISVKKDKGIWNPFSRWIAIPDIDIPDKKIMAACQRKAVNFPVQSAGADIMKISMILLCREFYKLGWLKQNNGDDSVRMLLTVHDEIVFEIKHERVQEALTVITTTMSSPTKIPGPPYSPKWKVPLVVEPLIGETWAGEYDYGMLMHGKPYKSGDKVSDMEIVVGDRVYHKVPPWLEGKFKPGYSVDGTVVEPAQPPPAEPTQPAASPVSVPAPQVSVAPPPVIAPPTMPTKQTSVQHKEPTRISGDLVFEHKLSRLTLKTVEDLAKICFNLVLDYDSPDARILHLVDNLSGETLISTSLDIRVIPNKFKALLREVNLY